MKLLRLLNRSEEITYERLVSVSEEFGARVFPKVRLADVFSVSQHEMESRDFGFALKSHFDFLATDANLTPLFAVEFDGPSHKSPAQRERDKIKDKLCGSFRLPLLRINENYLKRSFREMDLLAYFVETWFLAKAFDEAQQCGSIPWDADFDPSLIISRTPLHKMKLSDFEGGKKESRFPYWLSCDHQIAIKNMHKRRLIADWVSSCWVGWDKEEVKRCLCWIRIKDDQYAVIKTAMKSQQFPDYSGDLLSQLAIFDLKEKIDDIVAGRDAPLSREVLESRIKDCESRLKLAYRRMGGDIT